MPLYGGFNGLNIRQKEPFNNTDLADGTDVANYGHYSVRRAIDAIGDPEVAEYNLMALPGIWDEPLTNHMIEVCEARGDSLAVIDLKGDFQPNHEGGDREYKFSKCQPGIRGDRSNKLKK